MAALTHKHPLILIDLNPKYPYDEEVYDDEESLIIIQNFQSACNLCDREITYIHRYYYKCDQCDYSIHTLCGELPIMLENASHDEHTLTLYLDKSNWKCRICERYPWFKLSYHCPQCMFSICIECVTNKVQYHTLYHPSHQHPLVPLFEKISARCVCGNKHKGMFYHCVTCLRFFIHEDCVVRKKRLLIQDRTCGYFFHTHPLILTYSFVKEYQKAKYNPACRICFDSFSDIRKNQWIYKCEKCRYYVHIDCMDSEWMRSQDVKYKYEGDPNTLILPPNHETYTIITNFLFKEINYETSITHNSHEHPLVIVDARCNDITTPTDKIDEICNGCVRPIVSMPFYKCTYNDHECNFVLHEWCTRLPTKLEGYEGHPEHTLVLLPKAGNARGEFYCDNCIRECNGFAYSCQDCKYGYRIDVICAFITPGKIKHNSHPHLLSIDKWRVFNNYCRMCLSRFVNWHETSWSCQFCGFHLHPECGLLLPETIRHKYDKHPMVLSYTPVENYEGDYFCEVCEEELNPYVAFYHCVDCVQSMHTTCAPLIPQSRPYLFYRSSRNGIFDYYGSIKLGVIYKLIKDHPHPLSLQQPTKDVDDDC